MNSPNNQHTPLADARAVFAGLGVDTTLAIGSDGQPNIRLDRAAMEKLRDTAAAHGATAIAAALDIAIADMSDLPEPGEG